jgi:hypothetical protein
VRKLSTVSGRPHCCAPQAHHNQPPEKADARKPPEALRFPAVDSASESLTSSRVAADSVGSLVIGFLR